MRIAFVISSLAAGGAERVVSTMAGYWAGRGWDVAIITLGPREGDFYPVPPGVERIALDLRRNSSGPVVAILNNFSRLRGLRRAIRSVRPDAVISFVDCMNVLSLIATRGLATRIVVSERTDPDRMEIGRAWERLRKLTYPWADTVVFQSEWARKCLRKAVSPGASRVVPNPAPPVGGAGCGADSWARIVGGAQFRAVTAMGRLSREKGFDLLLTAFALASQGRPEWRLVVLGEGPERKSLERLARDLGIADRVRFPGRVREPLSLLPHADIFALSSRYEGFPNALLEGMACGLPAVAFDCAGALREIVRDGVDGLLVPPGDVGALARALGRLMEDEGERKRLAARAPEVGERFGLEKVMTLWEGIVTGKEEEAEGPA